ncbi:MAG: TonB-dependent receptor [Cyclobacteriaceae bacterium]
MKNVIQLTMILWLSPLWLFGQYDLSGKVVDSETNEPLSGASISIGRSNISAITDLKGEFKLTGLTELKVDMVVSYISYKNYQATVDLPHEQLLVISLQPQPPVPLEAVVIQAVRADEKAPVAQKTIDLTEIESQHMGQDAVFTLQKLTPSVLAHSEAGTNFANYSLMRLRGIDQTRINITLNGAPLNDMMDQGVFFSNFSDFGNSIQSAQVQRGVGTSTNGTASYAGSMNFESIRLNQPEPSVEVQLLAGSFGTLRASGEVKTGLLNKKWAFYSRFTKTHSDGYKFHSGTNSNSFFFSGGYFADKDLIKLTGFAGQTQNELAYLPIFIDDIRAEPRTNYLHQDDEDDFGQQFLQLEHTHWFNQGLTLSSSLYYGGAGGDFPFGFLDEEGNLVQINYPLYNDHFGLISSITGISVSGFDLTGGLHAYAFKRKNEESILPEAPYYSDRSQKNEVSLFGKVNRSWERLGLYVDLQLRFVGLELQPDLQFLADQGVSTGSVNVPNRSWTFFSPKIGLTYQINQLFQLYSSFGRGGREPTRFDLLGSTNINASNLPTVIDQEAVQAEFVNDLEVGTRFSSEKLKGQLNFFYMNFDDEIAPTGEFIAEGFVQLRQNIADSYRSGIELEWNWQPLKAISFSGNTTFMESQVKRFAPGGSAEVFNNVTPILSPKLLANGMLNYEHEIFNLSLSGRYVSESFLELTNQEDLTMPSFFMADAQLTLKFLKKHSFGLQINNIFDKLYFTNGAPVDVDFDGLTDGPGYLVQAPRSFYGMLKLKF